MTSLRTLVITEALPYPPLVGKELRNWCNTCGLSSLGQVGIFGLCSNDPRRNQKSPPELQFWRCTTDEALAYPPPKKNSAALTWPINPLGHPSDCYYSEVAAAEIVEIIAGYRPDVVVIEGLWLYRYIGYLAPFNCRVVLDCHNVEAAVSQEIIATLNENELPWRLMRKLLPNRTKAIEQIAIKSVDQIWVCSENDARLMQRTYDIPTSIHVIPNALDVNSYERVRARSYRYPNGVNSNGKVLIFPALFGWAPNIVAASFLINELFPRLAKVYPDSQLILGGDRPSPEMIDAARQDSRIMVTGAVPDMRPYLASASAMVVPLFQGGGTRFKILEAFAAKLPVISTAKGAEGLAVQDGIHLLLAETADEFVDAVQRLWMDGHLAKQLAVNALQLVTKSYSFPVISQQIADAVHELCSTD